MSQLQRFPSPCIQGAFQFPSHNARNTVGQPSSPDNFPSRMMQKLATSAPNQECEMSVAQLLGSQHTSLKDQFLHVGQDKEKG